MRAPHPDKLRIIELVHRMLNRSGLTIEQVLARMQSRGCDISRNVFENRFTTRADQKPNIPPAWTLALVAAFTERLAGAERCTAIEAIELANAARLPLEDFRNLKQLFPTAEFIAAYRQVAPLPEPGLLDRDRRPVNGRCPYRGLQAFDEEHAEFFFGREADVEWLLAILQQGRFLAVVGPSGSGKSSVVRAGLIPALRRGVAYQQSNDGNGCGPRLIRFLTPGEQPLQALAGVLANQAGRHIPELIETLLADPAALPRLVRDRLAGAHLILVVDQFEELFTLCPNETIRRAFITNLLQAIIQPDSPVTVILTLRADFYSQAAAYPDLAVYLADRQALLSPLTESELPRIITCPARKVGLEFEPDLVELLLRDAAAEPGALPLLQHALLELWQRREGNRLTLAGYRASGGVRGALARRADSILAEMTPEQQAMTRHIMLCLIKLGDDTADTRRRIRLADLAWNPDEAAHVRSIVTRLADARLAITSRNSETGEETVELAHEALIGCWPVLQGWLNENRASLRLHQQLADAAGEWAHHGREEAYLYRGNRLAGAEEWATGHAAELSQQEREFLAASLAARDQAATEREQQRRRVIWSLAAGLVLAVLLALFAFSQRQQVETQRQQALSRQVAVQARDVLGRQPDLALLLSAEAFDVADTYEARSSLLATLSASPLLDTFLRGHSGWVWSAAFSPDGRLLASGSADNTVLLWDVATRRPVGPPLAGHADWVRSVTFSPDGRILASAGADDTIILWDVATRRPLGPPLAGHHQFITGLAFSPDGHILASASADSTVILWDVATRRPLGLPLAGHTSFVLSLAFSPDGRILASAGADEAIILWNVARLQIDVSTGQRLAQALTGHSGAVSGLAFSPDGRILASAGEDKTIRLWQVATRQPLGQPLAGHDAPVLSLAFSANGQTLASAGEDKTVRVWDISTLLNPDTAINQQPARLLTGHTDRVLSLTFNPDGKLLASGSADNTLILWDLTTLRPLEQVLTDHTGWVNNLAYSPDGRTLASGSADFTIRLWDAATGRPLDLPMAGHADMVTDVAFSPDGQRLVSASADRTIRVWDIARRQALGPPLAGHTAPVLSVAFSPDGRLLASSDEGGTAALWDVSQKKSTGPPAPSLLPVPGKLPTFSPDGRILALAGGGNTVALWSIVSNRVLTELAGHTSQVSSLTFSPDGKTLASGDGEGRIVLWDVTGRRPVRQPLTGHTGRVWSLTFSPDGRTLASGSEDQTIRLWDLATQSLLGAPLPAGNRVRGLSFSPDGQILASAGGNDGAIKLWQVNPQAWQQQVCRIAARSLSRPEWDRYLGDEPYRVTCPEFPPAVEKVEVSARPAGLPGPATPLTGSQLSEPGQNLATIVEEFDSSRQFIQTGTNTYISNGRVNWHIERSGGPQYVYRAIPPFSGNVRLTVRGQVDGWTNNCHVRAGIGDKPGNGLAVILGWTGGGCPTNGPFVDVVGAALDYKTDGCNFSQNWLWINSHQLYTVTLATVDGTANLSVEGAGKASGAAHYAGPYTTLWIGYPGDGDWPECWGKIETMIVEPLN